MIKLLLILLTTLLLFACGSSNSNKSELQNKLNELGVDVYLTTITGDKDPEKGYKNKSQEYLKNGILEKTFSSEDYIEELFTYKKDIYLCVQYSDYDKGSLFLKNGEIYKQEINPSKISSHENSSCSYEKEYYIKHGIPVKLQNNDSNTTLSFKLSIKILNDTAYHIGLNFTHKYANGVYWKNEVEHIILENGDLYDIDMYNGNLVMCGYIAKTKDTIPYVYVNSEGVSDTLKDFGASVIINNGIIDTVKQEKFISYDFRAISVDNDDIYIAGTKTDLRNNKKQIVLMKNGVITTLNDNYSQFKNLEVINGNIMIFGDMAGPNMDHVSPVLFINEQSYYIYNNKPISNAGKMAITKR